MPCEEGFRNLSSYFWLDAVNTLSQNWQNFYIFLNIFPLNLTLFSKIPYLTPRLKINYEIGCTGKFSEKSHRHIQDYREI